MLGDKGNFTCPLPFNAPDNVFVRVDSQYRRSFGFWFVSMTYVVTCVVSFWFLSQQQNPGNNVSRKTELVFIRVNVTLD
jgi:hypothetical protein